MASYLRSRKVSVNEIENLMVPLARDLQSVYIIMLDSCLDILKQAETEGWTEEKIISEIKKMFDDEQDHHEAERNIGM